jgi:hypothetical protein
LETELLNFDVFDLAAENDEILRFEGNNARNILLIYEPDADNNLLSFLERVFRAAQVDLHNDTFLLATERTALPGYARLCQSADFQIFISFGFEPKDFGLHVNWAHYAPLSFQGKTFLFCDAVALLLQERAEGGSQRSGPFWKALQHIFLNK